MRSFATPPPLLLLLTLSQVLAAAAFMHQPGLAHQRQQSVSSKQLRPGSVTCLEIPAGVTVTILSGLAILLRPESALWDLLRGEPQPSAQAVAITDTLCRSDGWELRAQIGPEVARSLGGTGRLARSDAISGTADVAFLLRFDVDPRFTAYPQGTATLLRASKFVSAGVGEAAGLWSVEVDERADGGLVPQFLEVRLDVQELAMSGQSLVPTGQMFLSAALQADEAATRVAALTSGRVDGNQALRFADGRITIKESGSLGAAAGLSQLVVVGTFDARPAVPPPPPAPGPRAGAAAEDGEEERRAPGIMDETTAAARRSP
jgi:hypothetical protein